MAGESHDKIELRLDSGMVSNQASGLADGIILSQNTRFRSGPAGTVERLPVTGRTVTHNDDGPVSLIPHGNSVAVLSRAHTESYGVRDGVLWRKQNVDLTYNYPAQKWSPLTATGGGVAFTANSKQTPMATEFCLRAGLLVGAVTYLEVDEDESAPPRAEVVKTVLRVLDPDTGAPVIEDVEIASDSHTSGSIETNSVLGAVPIVDGAGTATQVAVWWCEYDAGATTWRYKFRVVTVADTAVTVGAEQAAWTENVSAVALDAALTAVTQSCEGPTKYTYIGRHRPSDGKPELVRWDCATNLLSWQVTTTSVTMIPAGYLYQYHGFGAPHHTIDVAATDSHVAMVFRSDEGGALESVRILSATEAGGRTLDGSRVLPTTLDTTTQYKRLGITHQSETSGESWAVVGTADGQLVNRGNALPTATPHQFVVVSGKVENGVVTTPGVLGQDQDHVLHHAHTSERPFTAYDSAGSTSATSRATPFIPVMRSPRGYNASENPLGQKGLIAPQNNVGTIEQDPALEIHSWHRHDRGFSVRGGVHPICRVGVDRSIPASDTHSGGSKEPGRDHHRAKPLSEDGRLFAVPYLADRDALNNTPRAVRYALVDAEHAPRFVETDDGVTYVAAGTVCTWDGEAMSENTPISLPRLRAEEHSVGASASKFQATDTWYFNAVYIFRDAAGLIHRSQPNPNNLEVTIGGTDAELYIFVERPPTCRDGFALEYIGTHIYGGMDPESLVMAQDWSTGMPVPTIAEQYGENKHTLLPSSFESANTAAWWQGGELVPDAPTSMIDIASVADRLWGISGEERRVWFTKPAIEGHVFEWSALNEVIMHGASRPTAVSELDGRALIFTDTDAWTVFGEGPNGLGAGVFSTPQRVAYVGAVDARLVLRVPSGVVFKSKDGWFRLGPGYELSPWGEEVRDWLDGVDVAGFAYCLAAWTSKKEVYIGRRVGLTGGSNSLVWNWVENKWSYHTVAAPVDWAVVGDDLFALTRTDVLSDHSTGSSAEPVAIGTAWVRPAGLDGNAATFEAVFTAKKILDHGVTIEVRRDYDESTYETFTWSVAEVTALTAGDHYSLALTLPNPRGRAVKFNIFETSGAAGDAAFHPLGLTLGVEAKRSLWQQYFGRK